MKRLTCLMLFLKQFHVLCWEISEVRKGESAWLQHIFVSKTLGLSCICCCTSTDGDMQVEACHHSCRTERNFQARDISGFFWGGLYRHHIMLSIHTQYDLRH